MRIKNKDLEIAIEYIKKNSMSESCSIYLSDDDYGVFLEFTDKQNNSSRVKLFDANLNATPEILSIRKLYRED